MTDSPLLIEATIAVFGLVAMAIAFVKMRRVDAALDEKSAPVSAPAVVPSAPRPASVPARALSPKERDWLDKAVAAGHVFQDGRPRCQAGTCQETADHAQPRVERERGLWNFLRTRFGAPDRYVLRHGKARLGEEGTGDAMGHFLRTVWGGLPDAATTRPTAPKYCGTHAHVAREIAQEKLAELEHRTARFQAEREIDLATFEANGLDLEVRRRVNDEEARSKILREELIAAAEEARPTKERKRKSEGIVVPIRKRAAGVTSREGAQ